MTARARDATLTRGRGAFVALLALCAIACAGFVALGTWQVRREGWKLKLIHDVETRVHAPPVAAPGPADWPRAARGDLQYLHVDLRGRYLATAPVLVHGSSSLGYGYWVMAPFATDRGFIVLVNRGYVADTARAAQSMPPAGAMTLTGLLRQSEPGGGFLRRNHPAKGLWYSRDVAAIAAARGLPATRVAPYFVDADRSHDSRGGPVAGLTRMHFRNAHVGYAITWYLLALGALLGAGLIVRERWRRSS